MTWQNPWAVDGATVTGAMARLLANVAFGDAEGIASKGDCKVQQTQVAGTSIRVMPGGVAIRNAYSGGAGQSYAGYNPDEDVVPTTATGGSSRSDLVVARINDPEFAGQPPNPGEEDTYPYIETEVIVGVPATTKRASELNLGYPAVELARIDRPANTATVTDANIVDLRRLARPRTFEVINHIHTPNDDSFNTVGGWEQFPDQIIMDVDIPEWAVRAKITGFVEGIRLIKAGSGKMRIAIQSTQDGTQSTQINESAPRTAADRVSYNLGGEIAIGASLRGTTQRFVIQGQSNDTGSNGFLKTDSGSSGQIRVLLEEQPT